MRSGLMCGAAILDGLEGSCEADSACQPEDLLTDSYHVQEGEVDTACALDITEMCNMPKQGWK
jgi:hypothetical protein